MPDDEIEEQIGRRARGQSIGRTDCLNEGRGTVCERMEMEEVRENDDEVSAAERRVRARARARGNELESRRGRYECIKAAARKLAVGRESRRWPGGCPVLVASSSKYGDCNTEKVGW